MEIKFDNSQCTIEHDGLMIAEPTLEKAVESYGEGMFERGLAEARKMVKEGVDF